MAAFGQKQPFELDQSDVRFAPEVDILHDSNFLFKIACRLEN
jgi:hypothetical protein